MSKCTPLEMEFREILKHVKNAERLASQKDASALLAALKTIEEATVDAIFDHPEVAA